MTEVSDDDLSATGKKNKGNRTIYLVTMQSVPDVAGEEPVTIKGYLAVPKKAGKYPALIYYQGTDAGKSSLTEQSTFYNGDNWVEFRVSTRGQMLCRDYKYNYDFYSYCWGDTAKHYYRNAYLDCVRAVDFVKRLEQVDAADIFATGASQGGCFTYVAAALSGAFRAIAPGITGHADFPNGMRIVNWPRAKFLDAAKNLNMTTEQMNQFNSYYDVKNFAPYISCPVISNFSLQDATSGGIRMATIVSYIPSRQHRALTTPCCLPIRHSISYRRIGAWLSCNALILRPLSMMSHIPAL